MRKKSKWYNALKACLALTATGMVAVSSDAWAANYSQTQGGAWEDTATWGGAGSPGAAYPPTLDNATVNIGATVTYTATTGTRTIRNLTIGAANNDRMDMTGGDLTALGTVQVASLPGLGSQTLLVEGGTFRSNATMNNGVSGIAAKTEMTSGQLLTTTYNNNANATTNLSGGTFKAVTLTNNGNFTLGGTTTLSQPITTLNQQSGNLTFSNGVIDRVGTFNVSGGATNVAGSSRVVVNTDYTNTGFGSGNTFNRYATVTAAPNGVTSADIYNGGLNNGHNQALSTSTLTLGNIHTLASIAANGGAGAGTNTTSTNYSILNQGAQTITRGAIQTIGTGNITDTRLGGNGIVDNGAYAAGIAAGGSGSLSRSVSFTSTGSDIGALAGGQAVQIVDNFGETSTLAINGGAAYDLAKAGTTGAVPVANQYVGGSNTAAVGITNTSTSGNNAYTELLNANVTASGQATGGGNVNVAAGGPNGTVLMGVNTASAGHKIGSADVAATSVGGADGLGNTAVSGASAQVTGNVYNYAQASTLVNGNLGNVHKGDVAVLTQSLTNTATAVAGDQFSQNGYTDQLKAAISGGTPAGTLTPSSPVWINADGTNSNGGVGSATVAVALDTSSVGNKTNAATVSFTSDGQTNNISGLTQTLVTQTVTAQAAVYDYANAAWGRNGGNGTFTNIDTTHWQLNLGNVTQGSSNNQDLKVFNTLSGFVDTLHGISYTMTGDFGQGSGNWTTPFQQNLVDHLIATINTSAVGALTGSIKLTWDGFNTIGGSPWFGTSSGQNQTGDVWIYLAGNVISNGIPEPGMLWLFGSAGFGWMASRRKK